MKIRSSSGAGGAHIGFLGRPSIFCQVAGGDGGGGAGGGAGAGGEGAGAGGEGAGAGAGGAGGGNTEDIATTINRVMSAREKANDGKLNKRITETIQAAIPDVISAAIKQALEAAGLNKPGAQPGEQSTQQNQGIPAALTAEIEGKINAFRKESAEAKKIAEDERAMRLAAETRMRRQEERAKLVDVLSGGKDGVPMVRAEMLDDVVKLMLDRVVRDPDNPDSILWKSDKWVDREGYDNSMNYMKLEDGIKSWGDSPKGKAYAPPQNATGGGTRRPHGGLGRGRNADDPATDAEVGSLIVGRRNG